MYDKSVAIYDAIYESKDYAGESELLRGLIQNMRPGARSLLDIACGTGRHAEVLQRDFDVTGFDVNPDMLEIARRRCPDVEFVEGDMRELDLATDFDAVVCLFSSIGHVRSVDRLDSTLAAFARHLTERGIVVLEPWFTPATFRTGTITVNHVDRPDLKITWMYTSEVEDGCSVLDITYLIGTPHQVECIHEPQVYGLFTHDQYLAAFTKAGLTPSFDACGLTGRGLYVGTRTP